MCIRFFRFVKNHALDRQMDEQTDGRTDSILMSIPCVALHAVAR